MNTIAINFFIGFFSGLLGVFLYIWGNNLLFRLQNRPKKNRTKWTPAEKALMKGNRK